MITALNESNLWVPEWTLADRLRKARTSIDLNQRDFAVELQVAEGTYSQWEAGNSRPRDIVGVARRVEMLTRIPATWLLGLETQHPRQAAPAGDAGSAVSNEARPEGLEPPTF